MMRLLQKLKHHRCNCCFGIVSLTGDLDWNRNPPVRIIYSQLVSSLHQVVLMRLVLCSLVSVTTGIITALNFIGTGNTVL